MSTHFDGKVHGHLPSVLPAFDVHEPSIRSLLLVLVMILVELLFVRFVYVDQKTSQN